MIKNRKDIFVRPDNQDFWIDDCGDRIECGDCDCEDCEIFTCEDNENIDRKRV